MIPLPNLGSVAEHPTTQYALDVTSGTIVAGPVVRAACKRHLDDLARASSRGLFFDVEKANRALRFFPNVLRLNGGQFEGKPFILEPPQQFIIGSLFGWVRENGRRRFRVGYIEMAKGNGKALAIDTPIATPSGWTTMGELEDGDEILDDHRQRCIVSKAHPISTTERCFKLTFDDGVSIVASGDHQWLTEIWRTAKQSLKTTHEIAETVCEYHSIFGKRIFKCEEISSVPVRCITVNSISGLFRAGPTMIVTHNSPLVAGIGLFGLIADNEARAEVFAAATKRDQAMILFRDAVAMVNQSPALSKVIKKSGKDDKVWNLYHPNSNSFFRPISSDDGQSGPRPHIGLIDELHEHKTSHVINMMSAGRKWREQPLIIAITNSGNDKNSVCWEYHEMARQVTSGAMEDDTFFAFVCSLDDEDEPFKDESCWIKANPLLGSVITTEYLRGEVNQAAGMLSKESSVRRLNFCQWTEAFNPLVSMEVWKTAERDFSLELFRGKDVYIGLDLASTQDLTSAVITCRIDSKIYWWPEFWLPEGILREKVVKDRVPYDVWKSRGFIRTTPGQAVDKDFVVSQIAELRQTFGFRIVDMPFDRWRIADIKASCQRIGVSFPLTEFGQGFQSMAPAVDAFETALVQGELVHNGNPCLRWCAGNVVATEDPAGNRKLDKSKATGRIDGIVAGVMAHLRATQAAKPAEPKIRWLA